MKKIIHQFILTILLISAIVGAQAVSAQGLQLDPQLRPEYSASIPTSTSSNRAAPINIVLQLIAGSLIYAAGPIAILMIAVGGFRYITSRGDQNAMEGAKKTIEWAIIGLLIIIISYTIVINVIIVLSSTGTIGTDMSAPKK